jgi:hypothetical protein
VESLCEESKWVMAYTGDDKCGLGVGPLFTGLLSLDEQATNTNSKRILIDTQGSEDLNAEADVVFILLPSYIG